MNRSMKSMVHSLLLAAALSFAVADTEAANTFAVAPDIGQTRQESFRMAPDTASASIVRLDRDDNLELNIEAVKRQNADAQLKRLQIGVGRDVPPTMGSSSLSLQWQRVTGGLAGQWKVSSAGARALRIGLMAASLSAGVEIRFAGEDGAGTVYGPFTATDVAAMEPTYWSPVLEGEIGVVEVFVPDGRSPADAILSIAQVSHLFANPRDADVDKQAKASQACEVDLICLSATDAALANTGRAVARMTFSDGAGGGTSLCTGTLLNPRGGSLVPYFFSAAHCISTQASASTLTTHWFYDRTACGSGGTSSSYVQLAGGATLLYANTQSDGLFMRLNGTPPAGAVYSGWDETTLTTGVAIKAVHHPAGDLKKVSLGAIGGFSAYGGGAGPATHIIALWNSTATGVTEGGSSGSGIFTGSATTEYKLRGGLHGGPSSCSSTGTALRDYYSRFDQVYAFISQYLNPNTSCSYTLSSTSASVGTGATTGTITVTTTSGCTWSATSNASWLTTSSTGSGSGTVSYSVAAITGAARSGTITVGGQSFTVSQSAATTSSGTRLINISTRGLIQTGDYRMIGGFVISGSTSKLVLIRARGPSLTAAGVPGAISDTLLELYSGSAQLAVNDDWGTSSNASAISATGLAPTNSRESAILVTLNPGAYTAIVGGYQSATGVGIVEVFEVAVPNAPVINISTRGQILTGDNVMIGGFVISGSSPQTVLLRARGPSLSAAGVPGVISDPILTLYSGSTAIVSNDDWNGASNASAVQATGLAPTNSLESAILVTLDPGAYTAIVSGYSGATGVGIFEVFAQ